MTRPQLNISPAMKRMPATLSLEEIATSMQGLGEKFSDDNGLLAFYHVALNYLEHKHSAILT